MTVYYREPLDYAFGTLSQAAAIGDTTINSSAFTSLPNGVYAGGSNPVVLPVVLHNPAAGTHEVVWVTGHTGSASNVTVVRGKESTTAQAWPSGTQWIVAPTAARDGLGYYSATALAALTDGHVGMRALETDTGLVKTLSYAAGWLADQGVCLPAEVGPVAAGGSVPATSAILVRPGCVLSAAPSSGLVPVTFAKPFPNGYIGALAGSLAGGQFIGSVCAESGSTTGMQLRPVQYNGAAPGVCSVFYLAFGW